MKTVLDPSGTSLRANLAAHWKARPLFYQLALRDMRLRYRHTFLGAGWAVLQPLLPMLIFAAVFTRLNLDTGGPPYPLFVFSGFAIWIFIGNAVSLASPVFLHNFDMINKIYFPRAVLPLAIVGALAIDGAVAAAAVIAGSWWYGYAPAWSWLWLPVVIAVAVVVAMSAAVIAACVTTLLRDLRNVVPFVVQLWMYASPVLYPVSWIHPLIRPLAGLNPVTGVLHAFRVCLFGMPVDWALMGQSALAITALVCIALWLFHYLEADLAERV